MSKEEFDRMPLDQKITYIIDNLRDLTDDIAEQAVNILVQAGEIEYAVVLARDKGMIDKAIAILVDEGDYLWAALIAKNASKSEESKKLYAEGLRFYIDMEMFGRAISAAIALKLPSEEIEGLFMKGIEAESRGTDMAQNRAVLESAMESLEIALLGKEDDMSKQIIDALQSERARITKVADEKEVKNF